MTKQLIDIQEPLFWSTIKKEREKIKVLFPSIFKVPLIYGTKKQIIRTLLNELSGKVLDIGGGDRFVYELCKEISWDINYKSVDIDRSRFHDYYSLDEIQEKFDVIFLLDVIEHLSIDEDWQLLVESRQLLNPDGRLVITIPNNLHPTAFGVDCTHITSFRYHDLGGLLLACGFKDIQISRVAAKNRLKHKILTFLLKPLFKFLDIDFATGILFIAKNSE